MRRHWKVLVLLVGALGLSTPPLEALAQTCERLRPKGYPDRPLEFVVRYGAGGGSDQFARIASKPAERLLGKPIVTINIPGGAGAPALAHVMQQPADGYTLYGIGQDLAITEALGITPQTRKDVRYLVRGQYVYEMIFARTNDERFRTFTDVMERAKARPGKVTVAVAGLADIDEVIIRALADKLGISFKLVPYPNPGEQYAAFLSGQVDLLYEEPGDVRAAVLDPGKGRPLVVLAEKRLSGFEDVPTARELGADVTMGRWRGIAVKAGTPDGVVRYLECVFRAALESREYRKFERANWLHLRQGFLGSEALTRLVDEEYRVIEAILGGAGKGKAN